MPRYPEYPEEQLPDEEWVDEIRSGQGMPILAIQPWLEGPDSPPEWRDAWNSGKISADFATLAIWDGLPPPTEWREVEWQPLSRDLGNIVVRDAEGNEYTVADMSFQTSKDLFFLDVKAWAESRDLNVIINPSP